MGLPPLLSPGDRWAEAQFKIRTESQLLTFPHDLRTVCSRPFSSLPPYPLSYPCTSSPSHLPVSAISVSPAAVLEVEVSRFNLIMRQVMLSPPMPPVLRGSEATQNSKTSWTICKRGMPWSRRAATKSTWRRSRREGGRQVNRQSQSQPGGGSPLLGL